MYEYLVHVGDFILDFLSWVVFSAMLVTRYWKVNYDTMIVNVMERAHVFCIFILLSAG